MINEVITLSNREEQVLKLLLEGYLQKQIGAILGISESRVQDVKGIIKKKWGVQTDIDFFLAALKRGYLDTKLNKLSELDTKASNTLSNAKVKYHYASNM